MMRAEPVTGRSLEIGSGYNPTDGFTHRCDLNPRATRSDACCPADRLPWDDGYFDEIRAVDIFEHVSYRETRQTLAEWRRVLRPDGLLYVQVPDVDEAIRMWQADPRCWDERSGLGNEPAIVGLAWVLLGGQGDGVYVNEGDNPAWNLHMALFNRDSLCTYLAFAGFVVDSISTNSHPNVQCWARAV